MSDFPEHAFFALAALAVGKHMESPDGEPIQVYVTDAGRVEILPESLAVLEERALIRWGDEDESGFPRSIHVTEHGKAFLKRHMLATGKIVTLTPKEK